MKKTDLVLDKRFDPRNCRHTVNGSPSVLHCHHYATLYAQLADDCSLLDGKKLLAEVAEDTFSLELANAFKISGADRLEDRIAVAEQLYAAMGLGKMCVVCAGRDAGVVELVHSHVDEGWIKKWGKRDKPVNFMTAGYVAALFSTLFGLPCRSYEVIESASIVAGAARSRFDVTAK